MAPTSLPWTDQDLLTLMCTLNFKIEEIRSKTTEDQKLGLLYASNIISEEIGNGCTPSRVTRKIRHLWTTYGNPDGDKEPYDLCRYGAFPKTLPGVTLDFFKTVNSTVEQWQREASILQKPSTSVETPNPGPRQSRRKAINNIQDDPVGCRCGFTHNIVWVHCDQCSTWQHAYCYYDTEDEMMLPNDHFCDDCCPFDEKALNQKLGQLHLQLEKVNETRISTINRSLSETPASSIAGRLGPFGLPFDKEVMWGPEDGEIRSYLEIIMSHFNSVAHSMEPELEISKNILTQATIRDTSSLIRTALNPNEEFWGSTEIVEPTQNRPKRRNLIRSILAASVTAWVFDVPNGQSLSNYDSILLHHYQDEIFKKNDMSLLEDLHRQSYIRMMEDSSPLQKFIAQEAEKLSDRCLEALLPITNFGQQRPPRSIKEWTNSRLDGLSRRDRLAQAFKLSLKLKRWLPLAQKHFEFYVPALGSSVTDGLVTTVNGSIIGSRERVKLCLMPGLIEFSSTSVTNVAPGPQALFGEENFLRASDEQRKEGRVISPAIVTVN